MKLPNKQIARALAVGWFLFLINGCADGAEESPTDVSPEALVGYWISVEPSEISGTHLFIIFTPDRFLDIGEMIPYSVTDVRNNRIFIEWTQEAGLLGSFQRQTVIHVHSDETIRIQYDKLTDGYRYERVSRNQWETQYAEQEALHIEVLRESLQKWIQQTAPGLD